MLSKVRILAAIITLAATTAFAQQPQFLHARLTTASADHGLNAELDSLRREAAPLWVGYNIPVAEKTFSDRYPRIDYLEADHPTYKEEDATSSSETSYDHAVLLFRIANHAIEKIRVENPNRQVDAGNLRVVWLSNIAPGDSIAVLKSLALSNDEKKLRDNAVFAISIHRSPETLPTLIGLAAPANPLDLREKAAFWVATQHSHAGFAALQNFARKDTDAAFREKIAFDLNVSNDPDAVKELIRMAHQDASPQVRRQAQFWMATKGGKVVAGDLRDLAENDPDTQVRKSAVFALSRLPQPEATTQLIQVAGTSKDPAVRKQAVFWLGQSRDPRALDYLTRLLQQ